MVLTPFIRDTTTSLMVFNLETKLTTNKPPSDIELFAAFRKDSSTKLAAGQDRPELQKRKKYSRMVYSWCTRYPPFTSLSKWATYLGSSESTSTMSILMSAVSLLSIRDLCPLATEDAEDFKSVFSTLAADVSAAEMLLAICLTNWIPSVTCTYDEENRQQAIKDCNDHSRVAIWAGLPNFYISFCHFPFLFTVVILG